MRAFQFRLEQPVGLVEQAGLRQRLGGARNHRLALVVVAHLTIRPCRFALHVLDQHAAEGRRLLGRRARPPEPGERDARDQRRHAIALGQPRIRGQAIQRRGPEDGHPLALRRAGGRQQLRDLAGVTGHQVEVLAHQVLVGQDGKHLVARRGKVRRTPRHGARRGIGPRRQRLQQQPAAGRGLVRGAGACEPRQRRGSLCRRQHLLLVGVPRVVRQQPPRIGIQLHRRRSRLRQQLLHRLRGLQPQLEHLQVLPGVDLARQPRQFGPVGPEQDHRRVAPHLEARRQLLGAGQVTVEVDRNEALAQGNEVGASEERRLHLVAGRTPRRAPVREQRQVLLASLGKCARHISLGMQPVPAHTR